MYFRVLLLSMSAPAVGLRAAEEINLYEVPSRNLRINRSSLLQRLSDTPPKENLELPCVGKLSEVIFCDEPAPVKLSAGNYGMGWLVKNKKTGKAEVLKLIFASPSKDRFATIGDYVRGDPSVIDRVEEGQSECSVLRKVRRIRKSHPHMTGANSIMSCIDINYDFDEGDGVGDRDHGEPLYSLFSYAGDTELGTFIDERVNSDVKSAVVAFRKVFKQVLQGIDFLTKMRPLIIHHDLKPSNIVVKTTVGKDGLPHYNAQIVDFGALALGTADEDDVCFSTARSPPYAPPEYGLHTEVCKPHHQNFDPEFPEKFDVFSLAMTYFELLSGNYGVLVLNLVSDFWCTWVERVWCPKDMEKRPKVPEIMDVKFSPTMCTKEFSFCETGKVLNETTYEVDYEGLQHIVSRPFVPVASLFRTAVKATKPVYVELLDEVVKDERAENFMLEMFDALMMNPADRPTPADLLKHEWMQETQLDAFDEEEEVAEDIFAKVIEKKAAREAAAAKAAEEAAAAESAKDTSAA